MTLVHTHKNLNMEVFKMVEGQSRYGIMEELNSKKLTERSQLSNLEADKENGITQREEKISQIQKEVSSAESTYELDHKRWKSQRESEMRMKTANFNNEFEGL
mgnify:CR=1 FL=1